MALGFQYAGDIPSISTTMATAQAPKAYEVKEGAAQDVDITWANDITKVDLFIAGGLYEWKGTTHLAVPLVEPLSANIRKSSGTSDMLLKMNKTMKQPTIYTTTTTRNGSNNLGLKKLECVSPVRSGLVLRNPYKTRN